LLGIDQIAAELMQAEGEPLRSEIHQLVNYISNKEEFPALWKESVVVPLCKKGDKTDCRNYGGMPLLSNLQEN
jgi:hypothetical protein